MSEASARICPVDQTPLRSGVYAQGFARGGVTIDRCPTCDGIWLDKGELTRIRKAAAESGKSDSDDFAFGFILGTSL